MPLLLFLLNTLREGQFLDREGKKQTAAVAGFGTERCPFVAGFHLMSALRTGQPILRLVFHAVPLCPLMHELDF